jgi:hypothetical protein
MIKKRHFLKCFDCKNSKKIDNFVCNIYDIKNSNIPRKKKKKLKKFLQKYSWICNIDFFDMNKCNIGVYYKDMHKYFSIEPLFKKYKKEIIFLFRNYNSKYGSNYLNYEELDGSIINENFELELYYENDDYYCNSGLDKVNWNNEECWTYKSMNNISQNLFGMPLHYLKIENFKDFLEEMKK